MVFRPGKKTITWQEETSIMFYELEKGMVFKKAFNNKRYVVVEGRPNRKIRQIDRWGNFMGYVSAEDDLHLTSTDYIKLIGTMML